MKNINKFFTIMMLVLVLISAALVVWGFSVGFESNDGRPVDVLFYWTYVMIGIALFAVIVLGLILMIKNDPKSLIKLAIVLVGTLVLCGIAYVLAPGSPAMGMLDQPDAQTLKLTDTVLNLTYILGGAAILSIVAGEIVMSVRNKK